MNNSQPDQDLAKWLAQYFAQRGGFLAQVIRADLQTMPLYRQNGHDNGNGHSQNGHGNGHSQNGHTLPNSHSNGGGSAIVSSGVEAAPSARGLHDIGTILIDLVAEQTGYPKQSITLESRLLDDLNLDSIKAGELVAAAAKVCGLAGQLDPATLSNVTLREIAEVIYAALPETETAPAIPAIAPPANNVSQMLLQLVADTTGFPQATLSLDMRLLDDLNLDSIKAADLIATAAKQLGVGGELDPSTLANATLADVVAGLEAAQPVVQPIAPVKPLPTPIAKMPKAEIAPLASWVRNFAIEYVEAASSKTVTDWTQARIRLVADALDSPVAAALAQLLCILGAKVEKLTYSEVLSKTDSENSGFSHFIAVLPHPADSASDSFDSTFPLEQMVARLRSIATPPTTQANPYVMYVQFGGGTFGSDLGTPEASPEVCCAAAFARSLHLERPALRVRVVDLAAEIAPNRAAELVTSELTGTEPIVTVGYNAQEVRLVPQARLQQPADYSLRSIAWSKTDVILVTGGAKGITAECALAIAQFTGVKMALVGRSPAPTNGDGEIAQTLERFRAQELTVRYYACDIANPDAVAELVTAVTAELGTITGVIHGAGLNTPRRLEQISLESAQAEISPKLLGAHNLLHTLTVPPKLFIAFSSIIGVTGMPGNTWYGFTNEALDILLRRFASHHPETSVLSLAYSVWAEVGMGARMGSVKNLERMGIGAISNEEGVDRCLKLFQCDPGVKQVVIAARLGGLDTWTPVPLPPATDLRFIEQVRHLEPGVELTVRTHLSLERDLYVKDHIWRGSYLFPTVFGLEAMAQAAAYVTGEAQPAIVRLEAISLRRPVVVNPTSGVDIEIHAEVAEINADGERLIKVGIRTEQTGFASDHFSAVLVLGQRQIGQQMTLEIDRPLAIDPKVDLYGSLLFQGTLFQQMDAIFSLSRERSLLQSHTFASADLKETGFPIGQGSNLLLGDPYFRDVLLQCMQLNIPQDICLPVQIDRIELCQNPALAAGTRTITAILNQRIGQEYICEVIATDEAGIVVEHLQGYRLRILEEHPENPTALELACPELRDQQALQQALSAACIKLGLSCPSVELGYVPGLGAQPKKQRRAAEQPIAARALQRHLNAEKAESDAVAIDFTIKMLSSGKPQLSGAAVAGLESLPNISLSHDDHYCLCSIGETPQGCDIESVGHRATEDWVALLSTARTAIVDQLVQAGDDRDRAGTRIWSALEAVRKAFNGIEPKFSIVGQQGTAVLLQAKTEEAIHFVLTVPVQLTRYPERMVALVVERTSVQVPTEHTVDPYGLIRPNEHRAQITEDGPQEQPVYEKRFPVTFKEGCGISRKVTVSQYISWVGKIRELPMRSMAADMVPDFLSGEWGMVTNSVSLRVLGEATTYDTIQARCWLGNLINSTFDTYIEFCKVLPDETLERVALAEVKATWVRLVSYGIPSPEPFPAYLQTYLDRFASKSPAAIDLRHAPTVTLPPLPTSLSALKAGSIRYQSQDRYGDLLLSEVFQTTLEESNLVGNVYYGNYFIWQGRVMDLFLYSVAPEYLRVSTAQGEMISVYSHMNFMREAMPFDRIRVLLYVESISECGAVFNFEFFREQSDQRKEKLHTGQQEVIWAQRLHDGTPIATPWPQPILKALMQAKSSESIGYAISH